jgi:L-amino acid N-acyltransferase YncA
MMELRLADPDDAEAILAIYEPLVRETSISFEIEPPDVDEIARRMTVGLTRYPWLVAVIDGVVSFRARAAYQWSAETSVYISPAHQRSGIARRLYGMLMDLLTRQGFRVAWAGITLPNHASVALHESSGFVAAGVLERVGFKSGRWHDVGLWRLQLGPDSGDPGAPPCCPDLSPGGRRHDLP